MNRHILVVISDTHAGHKLGLCNPETRLYSEDENGNLCEYTPELNEQQNHLWNNVYLSIFDRAKHIARGCPITLLHLGDQTNGNKHPDQNMTSRMADQIIIALANAKPWLELDNLKTIRLVIGTGAHEFGEGSSSILIQSQLASLRPDIDIKVVYHGLATINGRVVDYSHHGPGPGIRSWLNGNMVRFYLRDIIMRDIAAGKMPPTLVLRGHKHDLVNEVISYKYNEMMLESRMVVVPSLCMLSDYARQVTMSQSSIVNGGAIFEIDDLGIRVADFVIKSVDIRTKEKL